MSATNALPAGQLHQRAALAAAELCAERGYRAMTMVDIADRAGLAPDQLEVLFADKRAVTEAAIETILTAVLEQVSDVYSPDRSEAESYVDAIGAILRLTAQNPALAYASFITARQGSPAGLGIGLANGARLLSAMLERLWEGSEARRGPARAARAAVGAAETVVRREVAAGRAAELPRLLPDLAYMALVPFLGQREALRMARAAGADRRT